MGTVALPKVVSPSPSSLGQTLRLCRRRLAARLMQRRVRSRDFSIISNDCWGGLACNELECQYRSPFVGLFLMPGDYMRMLRALPQHLNAPLRLVDRSKDDALNSWREEIGRHYPIGLLGDDVEIQFLNYESPAEAEAKWRRRVARINWNKLLVKICWHDDPRMNEWLEEFEQLPFAARVALVPPHVPRLKHTVQLRDYSNDGAQQYWRSHKCFDIAAWINSGVIRRVTWTRALDWLLYWRY